MHKEVSDMEDMAIFFRHSLDLMAIVGKDGFFKRVNPAFESLLGFSEAEMYARPVVDFLHPQDVTSTRNGILTLAAGTQRFESKNRYLCKNGTYKWLSWNTNPVGSFFYAIGRDVTKQVESEEQIRQLNHELARHNDKLETIIQERLAELRQSEAQVKQLQKMDAIGRLAGGIAHDFNNMLAVVTMCCDLLAEDATNAVAVQEHAKTLRSVGERAAALTRQLLIFSRKQISQFETINLNPLIRQLEQMLVRIIGEDKKIILKLSEDLRQISADPSQLEQVMLNLVVNARDAMPGGGKITIETKNVFLDEDFTSKHLSVNRGHYVLITVTDEGHGMDAETVEKIFDPFFTTKPVGKGTGLGLSTAYGIIKQSKGTIWVYSEPGRGTVFKVYLPVSENVTPAPQESPVSLVQYSGDKTILLVEDDKNLMETFSKMLTRRAFRVLIAAHGEQALHLCRTYEGAIHVVLTDVIMPGMNGFELAKQLLHLRPTMRVLYMSGYTDDALDGSADFGSLEERDFIQKPFGANALVDKINQLLADG